jgi:Ca2+-binding RTX toxin-like protein
MSFRRLALIAIAATAVSLVAVSGASAAVTTTAVTSLKDETFVTYLEELGPSAPANRMTISGTSDGTLGDQVNLRCYHSAGAFDYHNLQASIGVNADGTWSGLYQFDGFSGTCLVRAVPVGADPTPGTPAMAPFAAKRLYASMFGITLFDGLRTDYFLKHFGTHGYAEYTSYEDCGLNAMHSYALSDTGRTSHATAVTCANYGSFLATPSGGVERAMTLVDGVRAYMPDEADPAVPGRVVLGLDFQQDPATGAMSITETAPLIRCAPSEASCLSYVPTGVTFERTWTSAATATSARAVEHWKSTDGATHQVDTLRSHVLSGTNGWKFPVDGAFTARMTGDVIDTSAWPSGVTGVRVLHTLAAGAADDDPNKPKSYFAYSQKPIGGWFQSAGNAVLNHVGTATPDAPWQVRFGYTIAPSLDALDVGVAPIEDMLVSPAVAITSPANGAALTSTPVTVTGTASDNVAVTSVAVNGVAATLTSGTWSVSVPLSEGSNVLTAIAKDAAGNETTASVTVSYAKPVPPLQRVFSGTAGDDVLRGNAADNILNGFAGNDRIFCGVGGKDVVNAGPGNDFVNCVEPYAMAKANADVVRCGPGTDTALVDPFDAVLGCERVTRVWIGRAVRDVFVGTKANDRFNTLGGNDSITCGGGRDIVNAGAGNDTINCYDPGTPAQQKASRDVVNCGPGRDTAIVDRYDVVRGCEKVTRRR